MKSLYKIALVLFLIPTIASAVPGKGKYTKSKKLSKNYAVSKSGTVKINNSFGNVTITTWDQPQVTFEVNVEVSGDNEERVNDRLRKIDVRFSSSNDFVEANTQTDGYQDNDNGWSFWDLFKSGNNSSNNGNLKIDYIVKMPVTAKLDITNDYGAIILDRLEGRAEISCDFGRLDIGQLMATNNEIKFDYTKSSNIDYMKSGVIKADFSDFDLYGCEELDFRGDYSKARLHKTKMLKFNSDFSTVESDESEIIDGRGDYSTIRLGTIIQKADLNTDFGTIKVKEIGPDFKSLEIRSDYTGIDLNYHPMAKFNFDADLSFANIKLSQDAEVTRSEKDTTNKRVSGYVGANDTGSMITIKSEFGNVSLKSN